MSGEQRGSMGDIVEAAGLAVPTEGAAEPLSPDDAAEPLSPDLVVAGVPLLALGAVITLGASTARLLSARQPNSK